MERYTLKLITNGYTYNLYKNGTLVSDSDLATLFATAGSAYFTIDANGHTISNAARVRIYNSQSQSVMYNSSGLSIVDGVEYKGTWNNNATTFASFTKLPAKGLTEVQLTFLMHQIKNGGGGGGGGGVKTLTSADYNWDSQTQTPSTTNPDCLAFWVLDTGYYEVTQTLDIVMYEWSSSPESFEGIVYVSRSSDDAYVTVITCRPDSGGVMMSGMWNQYNPGLYSGSGWTNITTDAMVASQIRDRIYESINIPDSTTYGTGGQVLSYYDSTNFISRLFTCSGDEQDPQTGDYIYHWQEIGSGFGTLTATPTSSTFGVEGRLYRYDTTGTGTYEIWLCLADDGNGAYTWKQVNLT